MSKNKQDQKKKKIIPINFNLFPFKNNKQPYIVLAVIGFILYINTIYNEFALDDGIIIHKNEYVMEGMSGIDSIMSRDAYHSFYKQMNAKDQLAGGRYRPLSIVTFAIEQEFIGKHKKGLLEPNSWDKNKNGRQDLDSEDVNHDGLVNDNDTLTRGCGLRHFNNMLFYIISILLMFNLLRNYLFKNNPDLAFLATFIFCIHPLHTEVVANMKSRDEILSILFIMLTFIYTFKFNETFKQKTAIIAAVMYFLALLSKEYAVTLVALVPIALYLFVEKFDFSKNLKLFAFMGVSLIIYMCIRFSIVVAKPDVPNTEVLNNPYLFATPTQVFATKIFVLLKYIYLLFFPAKLSSDYSYNTILYRSFSSWDTLLSIVVHVSLILLTIKLFIKKHPLAFALLFYFANLAMIGNIFFDIGATMGERLIYHSSFGFAICIAWLFTEGLKKINIQHALQQNIVLGFSSIALILCGYKTITRNAEWKNDITLFTTDVNTVPNSVLCLGNAGARWIDLSEKPENSAHVTEYLNKAIGYLNHALELHPKYVNGYLNLGLAYYKLGKFDKAEEIWGKAKALYPNNPFLNTYYQYLASTYMSQGIQIGKAGDLAKAIPLMEKASVLSPYDPEIWYNLGGAEYTIKDYDKARMYFEKCLKLNPNHAQAKQGYESLPR